MRRLLLPATLLFLTAAATTGYAGAGLPKIIATDIDARRVEVSADSLPVLANGTTFTVAITNVPPDAPVALKLIGPGGEVVEVPLKPLKVVEGPAAHGGGDDHGAKADDHGAAPAKDSHGAAPAKDSHGTADAGHGDEADQTVAGFNARGRAALSTPGHWTAVLEIADDQGHMHDAKAEFEVVPGGPNRIYLGFTGALMGGTVIYSLIQRRRQPQ